MLTMYVMPTDEELFKKYNPELQKRSLERRAERQQEINDWVENLKRQSRSKKPSKCPIRVTSYELRVTSAEHVTLQDCLLTIPPPFSVWVVQEEETRAARQAHLRNTARLAEEAKAQREAMRKEAGLTPELQASSKK